MEPRFHHVADGRSKSRRIRLLAIPLVAVSALFATGGGVIKAAASTDTKPYYLSLGDSLSQGVEPNKTGASVVTNRGYADDLFKIERHQVDDLKLAKLGCPGETSGSMRTGAGSLCAYPLGSQLAQAVDFIQHHKVAFITIDIGANNVNGCLNGVVLATPIPPAVLLCLFHGLAQIFSDLDGVGLPAGQLGILPSLRAAGPTVPIFGMNYYNPYLAAWLTGPAGQTAATISITLASQFNTLLGNDYAAFSIPVADVGTAFLSTNQTIVPFVNLPVNVLILCALTYNCTPPPVGPNIHANDAGYLLIAQTFATTIGKL